MPIHMQWDEQEGDLIRVRFEGQWQLEDLVLETDRHYKLLRENNRPIYYIIDARSSSGLPRGNVIPHLQRIFKLEYQFAVLVGGSYAAHMLINMILNLRTPLNRHFRMVKTMEEAEEIIHKKREEFSKEHD
ncbi:MAG: hypothetical protein KC496_09995 [Anaerolineae bacterium]|nr:hypothetical protein [Anaerolineae bacterium]